MPEQPLASCTSVIEFAGASIVGRHRVVNEDAWGANRDASVFVVADGCGGASSGRSAADIVVETIGQLAAHDLQQPRSALPPPAGMEPLAAAVHVANAQVLEAAVGDQRGMGSAVAAIRFDLPWLVTVHAGDCRAYRYRRGYGEFHGGVDAQGGLLTRLTQDHDLTAAMLREGRTPSEIEAVARTHGNVITRALGTCERVDIDVQYLQCLDGDLFLLCTDGLTRQLPDEDLRRIISDERRSILERCDALVHAADDRVGHDNVTALLIRVGKVDTPVGAV